MIKMLFNLVLTVPVVLVVAATGTQIETKNIDSDTLRGMASGWNSFATNVHEYVVENDEEVIEMSKKVVGVSTDTAINAISAVGKYADENRDEISAFAENAGESFGELLSDQK